MKTVGMVILVVALVGALTLLLLRRPAANAGPTDDDVIEQLRKAGSDLSKPHPIDFYVYVPSEQAGSRISSALTEEGFSVKVRPAAKGPGWLALSSKTLVPTSRALSEARKRLTALATAEGGDYDGWEAAVMK